jgi:hypothetical protein
VAKEEELLFVLGSKLESMA